MIALKYIMWLTSGIVVFQQKGDCIWTLKSKLPEGLNKHFTKINIFLKSMSFNTCFKYYNGLAGREIHSSPFPPLIGLRKKKEEKKDHTIWYVQSTENAAVYSTR